jgi:hypothetical protein
VQKVRIGIELGGDISLELLPKGGPLLSFLVNDGLIGQRDVSVAFDDVGQVVLAVPVVRTLFGLPTVLERPQRESSLPGL